MCRVDSIKMLYIQIIVSEGFFVVVCFFAHL